MYLKQTFIFMSNLPPMQASLWWLKQEAASINQKMGLLQNSWSEIPGTFNEHRRPVFFGGLKTD